MKRYRLNKYLPEEISEEQKIKKRNVLDSHLESIYKKTDKVANSLEKYMDDVAKLDKRIKKKFENEGITPDEYIRVATSLKLIMNRLEDMEKHIQSIDNNMDWNILDFREPENKY